MYDGGVDIAAVPHARVVADDQLDVAHRSTPAAATVDVKA
jgi:hypothetical protein